MAEAEVHTPRPEHSPLSPPPSDTALQTGKSNGADAHEPEPLSPEDVQRIVTDIWQVLQSHDPTSSILDPISQALPSTRSSNKPSAKKQKLSHASDTYTILQKVEQSLYTTLDDFAADFQTATTQLLASIALPSPASNGKPAWSYAPDAQDQEQRRLAAQAKAFQHFALDMIRVEARTDGRHEEHNVKSEANELEDEALPVAGAGRAVLTLFGNAQGHKQLFSSFQRPLSELKRQAAIESGLLSSDQAVLPLRETGLPNNMFSTTILPVAAEDVASARKGQTFGEAFAPPPSIPQLQPPKSRNGQARGDAISWTRDKTPQETRRIGYTHEKLPTGQWLGYGGVVQTQEPTSPEAKRKRRDRALSTGEAVLTPSEGAKAAQLQAKEDALFRCAYSSFAPSKDNSGALISEEDKSQIWWERFGHEYFEQTSSYPLDGIAGHNSSNDTTDEDAEFAQAVADFEPVSYEAPTTKTPQERETAELLADISEMLETLHSHQRIRNSSLTGNPKSSISPSPSLNDLTGTPSTPSSAEMILHDTLKQHLALMVSMLPPYAVAKLNGDQLEELNISRHVPYEDADYRGVMDEDQGSRLARQAALQAAVGAAAAAGTPARSSAATPGSYGGSRAPTLAQPTRPPGTGYGGYQPSTMPRGSSFARQPLSSWQSPAQQAYQRHGYAHTGYNAQTASGQTSNRARPSVGGYPGGRPQVNGYGAQYPQRPASQAYASPSSGFGVGSPVPRNASPQGYQAPTPQMTRPGSSSHSQYAGNQSPPQARPGSAYASHPSPSKAGPAGYLTPTASSVNSSGQQPGTTAAATASRPQTPTSVVDALSKVEQGTTTSMSGTPVSGA